ITKQEPYRADARPASGRTDPLPTLAPTKPAKGETTAALPVGIACSSRLRCWLSKLLLEPADRQALRIPQPLRSRSQMQGNCARPAGAVSWMYNAHLGLILGRRCNPQKAQTRELARGPKPSAFAHRCHLL